MRAEHGRAVELVEIARALMELHHVTLNINIIQRHAYSSYKTQ